MNGLAFLSVGDAPSVSPLAGALAGAEAIGDLSTLTKVEVRGEGAASIDGAVPISATRALVVCEPERRDELLREPPGFVVDVTAAYAGIEVEGAALLQRVTDLDLDALPAAGKVAGAPALLERDGERFRIWFPQELGASVVEAVRDAQAGLA